MSDPGNRFQKAGHRDCWDLLPWLVNGTLTDAQRQRLELHLAGCAECRREAGEQRVLLESLQQEESVLYAPQASFHKLMQRLDDRLEAPLPTATPGPWFQSRAAKLLAATVVVGALTIVAIDGVSSWQSRSAARYSTLTSRPATIVAAPAARVVFEPSMSLAQLSELLRTSHAQVVTGPSEAGVYTLVFAVDAGAATETSVEKVGAAVQALRGNPHVLFAELVVSDR